MDFKINSSKVNKLGGVKNVEKKVLSFRERITNMALKLAERAEREVPEYGDFKPVIEEIPNVVSKDPVDRYALSFYKMPKNVVPDPKTRYIDAIAYMSGGEYKMEVALESGNKDELIKTLKSPDFPEKLDYAYAQLLKAIKTK
jgi:hypothetical protein